MMIYEIEDDEDFRNATVVRDHGNPNRAVVRQPVGAYPPPQRYYPPRGGVSVRPPAHLMPMAPAPNYGKVLKIVGLLVDVIGQGVAAFMPLPAAPTIVGDSRVDDQNMKLYHEALAKHAKTDERIRTIAKVVREALEIKAA